MNRNAGVTNPRTMPLSFVGNSPGGSGLNWGNAAGWAGVARTLGYKVFSASNSSGDVPQVGDIAQWVGANHVAYVEAANADGSIDLSEFNYAEDHTFLTRRLKPSSTVNGSFPQNFIRVRTMAVQPGTLTFPSTRAGSSASLSITVTNTDIRGPLSVALNFSGPQSNQFHETDTWNVPIASMSTCQISVSFSPTRTGTKTANLKIKGTAGTQIIALSGVATK